MSNGIIVIAEHSDGQVKSVTYELIAFAAKLQAAASLPVRVLILGAEVLNLAEEIAAESGFEVLGFEIADMPNYNGELYTRVLAEHLPGDRPVYVCIAHTSQGMDFAPSLAVQLNGACISGIEDVLPADDGICFARAVYSGKALAHIRPDSETTVLTIQPGLFKPNRQSSGKSGRVIVKPVPIEPQWWHSLGIKRLDTDSADISQADVIVAAGRGFGNRDNLELAHQLASVFSKSAVAGSRIVCDLGWLEYGCQVGVTGATISPRLYIACGISGAIQHVSGMRGSEFIVAINKDPAAAIFQVADICIVADLMTFIPTIIEVYRESNLSIA
jgi:electron transfer flavoprotein alpha subunit